METGLSPFSSIIYFLLSIFSLLVIVQVEYISIPPFFRYFTALSRIALCKLASSLTDSGLILYFISFFLPITPIPEQGRSHITISADSIALLSSTVPSHTLTLVLVTCILSIFSSIRSVLNSVRSLASTCPLLPHLSAAWIDFPPGAAHISIIWSPSFIPAHSTSS